MSGNQNNFYFIDQTTALTWLDTGEHQVYVALFNYGRVKTWAFGAYLDDDNATFFRLRGMGMAKKITEDDKYIHKIFQCNESYLDEVYGWIHVDNPRNI